MREASRQPLGQRAQRREEQLQPDPTPASATHENCSIKYAAHRRHAGYATQPGSCGPMACRAHHTHRHRHPRASAQKRKPGAKKTPRAAAAAAPLQGCCCWVQGRAHTVVAPRPPRRGTRCRGHISSRARPSSISGVLRRWRQQHAAGAHTHARAHKRPGPPGRCALCTPARTPRSGMQVAPKLPTEFKSPATTTTSKAKGPPPPVRNFKTATEAS